MTQGDWVGRYGAQRNILCAMMSPFDHELSWGNLYSIQRGMGPHHEKGDILRGFLTWVKTFNHRALYDPIAGCRRQAEWDDHGEHYNLCWDGPDIWIDINLAAGIHRVSLYFMNKDGHKGHNRCRDFVVEVKRHPAPPIADLGHTPFNLAEFEKDTAIAQNAPVLAHARVRDFWGDVYKQFLLPGPGRFFIRIARNDSINAIVSAVFIDKLSGPHTRYDDMPLAWLGGVHYHALPKSLADDALSDSTDKPSVEAANELWSSIGGLSHSQSYAIAAETGRLLAFRAATAGGAPEALLARWRWLLPLWMDADRDEFNVTMDRAWEKQAQGTPSMVWQRRRPLAAIQAN
jgi:hypothetical protein